MRAPSVSSTSSSTISSYSHDCKYVTFSPHDPQHAHLTLISCVPCCASLKDIHTTVNASGVAQTTTFIRTKKLCLMLFILLIILFVPLVVAKACMIVSFKHTVPYAVSCTDKSSEHSMTYSETPSETRTSEWVVGDVAYCLQAS